MIPSDTFCVKISTMWMARCAPPMNSLGTSSGVTPPDVFVFSDGRVLDSNELSIKGNLRYEKIGTDNAGNISPRSLWKATR